MTDVAGSAPTVSSAMAAAPTQLELVDLRDHRDDELLQSIHAPGGLYERSFPRDEEREDLDKHRAALWGGRDDTSPILHFIVARAPGEPREVLGFIAAEYYAESRCGLLAYLAVVKTHRNEKIASRLVGKGVEVLRNDALAAGVELRAVLGEVHDPAKADGDGDSMVPLDRIRAIHALGARRVPIPYVQPPLGKQRERARAFMLVAFPIDGLPAESLDSSVVYGFVKEYYEALKVSRLQKDVDFARSLVGLRDTLELSELVSQEAPTFVGMNGEEKEDGAKDGGVEQYGVAIHLVLEPEEPRTSRLSRLWGRVAGTSAPTGAERPDEADPLRSFEEDILAYADPYRASTVSAPFTTSTHEVPEEWALVSVAFPEEVTFRSEGRLVPLICEGLDDDPGGTEERQRTRRFLLRASKTTFRRGGLSVLHLVLGPDPGDPAASMLNEYDLIKLMKLWQPGEGLSRNGIDATPGSGEHRFVRFLAGRGEDSIDALNARDALAKLAEKVFGLDGSRRVDLDGPRAGTVQVLHGCCEVEGGDGGPNICGEIDRVLELEGAAELSPRLVALGGLVCGLLDFGEIDGDELADVFREVTHDDQLVRSFHKGTLLVACPSDRAFEAEGIRVSVGLSPYLLIPHAVLLHNEWWLAKAVRQLDDTVRGPGRARRLGKLEQIRADVAQTLSQFLVPNVFNYRDERSLYETGLRARGLHKRERAVRERLDELTDKLHARHERIRSYIGTALALILLVFTLSDVYDKHSRVYFVLSAAVTLALLALLFWLWIRSDDVATDGYDASS